MLTPYGLVKRERDHKAEHDMTMRQVRARVPCAPRACPCCARSSGHRSVCPRCARLRARAVHGVLVQFVVDMCQHVTVGRHHPVCPHLVRPRLPHPVPVCAMCWRYAYSRCARLLSPCLRCVCLLCVSLLCVPVLCAFVLGVWCASAVCLDRADFARQRRRHHIPRRPSYMHPNAPASACVRALSCKLAP